MSSVSNMFRFLSARQIFRRLPNMFVSFSKNITRDFADKPKTEKPKTNVNTKHVVQGTGNEELLRVRRARPGDVPRVLRFVREHARTAWPGLMPHASSHIILSDYVARALAQGHSMLAEQHEGRRGWSQIRGLALGLTVCPWDAALLEKWAHCVRCIRTRRLMHFTAHCLRAPTLHDKYRVHNILQTILIVPLDSLKSSQIVHLLATNSIQRARDVGFPLIRFDVTNNTIAKSLEDLDLKKEWCLSYDVQPEPNTEKDTSDLIEESQQACSTVPEPNKNNFIAVYTALTKSI